MSEKLVLIDGHSILNRAFYGVPGFIQFRGTSHECDLWLFKYFIQASGGRKAGISDGRVRRESADVPARDVPGI